MCGDCMGAESDRHGSLLLCLQMPGDEQERKLKIRRNAQWSEARYVLECDLGRGYMNGISTVINNEEKPLTSETDWDLAVLRTKDKPSMNLIVAKPDSARVSIAEKDEMKKKGMFPTLKKGLTWGKISILAHEDEMVQGDSADVIWCKGCASRKVLEGSELCVDCVVAELDGGGEKKTPREQETEETKHEAHAGHTPPQKKDIGRAGFLPEEETPEQRKARQKAKKKKFTSTLKKGLSLKTVRAKLEEEEQQEMQREKPVVWCKACNAKKVMQGSEFCSECENLRDPSELTLKLHHQDDEKEVLINKKTSTFTKVVYIIRTCLDLKEKEPKIEYEVSGERAQISDENSWKNALGHTQTDSLHLFVL